MLEGGQLSPREEIFMLARFARVALQELLELSFPLLDQFLQFEVLLVQIPLVAFHEVFSA